jgi:hypothetical protein
MRLPTIISATLLLSLSMNLPAISETSVEKAQYQTQANNSLNSRRLKFNKRLWERANIGILFDF